MMRNSIGRLVTMGAAAWLALAAGAVQAEDYKAAPGPHTVTVERGVWTDEARDGRAVPWKLFHADDADDAMPVVIWSHGAGGSREGSTFLGEHLASHGYAVFHIQHAGTDIELLRREGVQGMLEALRGNVDATVNRLRDVPFAVAQITAMSADGPYAGRFDTERMGMSGHSFGAITTMFVAGQKAAGLGQVFAVPSFDAAFALSPSPNRDDQPIEEAFGDMAMPIFHLTGTKDESPMRDFEAVDRQRPFETIDDVDQYLLVLNEAVHMTFSGRTTLPGGRTFSYPSLDRHHALIKMAAVAYWDAMLKDDANARVWLQDGGFSAAIADDGTFAYKPAAE